MTSKYNADTDPEIFGTEDTDNVTHPQTQAEEEAPTSANTGVYTHKFKTPWEYEGKTYEEITFDFSRLKGLDMLKIESEMQLENEYAIAAEISLSLQCRMASRAAKIGTDVILAMNLHDFKKITNAARDFLVDTGY